MILKDRDGPIDPIELNTTMDVSTPLDPDMTFPLSYRVRFNNPPLTVAEAVAATDHWGSSHAVILISLVYKDISDTKESINISVLGVDGRDTDSPQPLNPIEMFKAWAMMAHSMFEDDALPKWMREVAGTTHELIRRRLESARKQRRPDDDPV